MSTSNPWSFRSPGRKPAPTQRCGSCRRPVPGPPGKNLLSRKILLKFRTTRPIVDQELGKLCEAIEKIWRAQLRAPISCCDRPPTFGDRLSPAARPSLPTQITHHRNSSVRWPASLRDNGKVASSERSCPVPPSHLQNPDPAAARASCIPRRSMPPGGKVGAPDAGTTFESPTLKPASLR